MLSDRLTSTESICVHCLGSFTRICGGGMRKKSFTIYVIDDDASIRMALKRLLSSVGYHALTFESAEAFLECGLGQDECCLVLDIHLPGMTGFELQEKLSSRGAMVPFFFITAHDNPQWEKRAEEAGAVAYLKKPFLEQKFFNAIGRCFEKQISRKESRVEFLYTGLR